MGFIEAYKQEFRTYQQGQFEAFIRCLFTFCTDCSQA